MTGYCALPVRQDLRRRSPAPARSGSRSRRRCCRPGRRRRCPGRGDRGVHADHLAPQVHQRAAGVAGVDRGVGLHGVDVGDSFCRSPVVTGRLSGADDAGGDRAAQAQRRADRDDGVADAHAAATEPSAAGCRPLARRRPRARRCRRPGCGRRPWPSCWLAVLVDDLIGAVVPVGVGDHVVVGDDVALVVEHEAGAGRAAPAAVAPPLGDGSARCSAAALAATAATLPLSASSGAGAGVVGAEHRHGRAAVAERHRDRDAPERRRRARPTTSAITVITGHAQPGTEPPSRPRLRRGRRGRGPEPGWGGSAGTAGRRLRPAAVGWLAWAGGCSGARRSACWPAAVHGPERRVSPIGVTGWSPAAVRRRSLPGPGRRPRRRAGSRHHSHPRPQPSPRPVAAVRWPSVGARVARPSSRAAARARGRGCRRRGGRRSDAPPMRTTRGAGRRPSGRHPAWTGRRRGRHGPAPTRAMAARRRAGCADARRSRPTRPGDRGRRGRARAASRGSGRRAPRPAAPAIWASCRLTQPSCSHQPAAGRAVQHVLPGALRRSSSSWPSTRALTDEPRWPPSRHMATSRELRASAVGGGARGAGVAGRGRPRSPVGQGLAQHRAAAVDAGADGAQLEARGRRRSPRS